MDKIQKINSVQGSFDAGANASKLFADFQISSGAVINMKDSYINVCMKITHTDTNETAGGNNSGGRGVQILDLGLTDSNLNDADLDYPNVALVKNAFMKGSNVGKIDDVRRCDALKSIMYAFEKDNNDKEDKSYYSLRGTIQSEGFRNSPFQHLERVGSNISVNKVHNVKIRMSEIFDICNETQLDTNKTGNLDIHLELNLDKLEVKQELKSDSDVWTETPARQTDNHNSFQNQTGATGGQTGASVQLKNIYSPKEFKRFSLYHVGQKLSFSATGGTGGAISNYERRITSIDYDNTAGTITLNLDSNIVALGNTETLEGITVVGTDIATSAIEVEKIEMVLHEVANPSNVPTSYSYFTYPLEEDNITTLTMRKNYNVEGDSQNVYVALGDIMPTVDDAAKQINKYRFSLNNEDLTNRDIKYSGSEHNDQIVRTYKNNQRRLKNITKSYIDATKDLNDTENNALVSVIMTPLIQRDDAQQSILSLDMERTTDPIGDIKIYQERVKTI